MNEQDQRIAIAEACGWVPKRMNLPQNPIHWEKEFPDRIRVVENSRNLPNYLGSLDLMHEAEKVLTHEQCGIYNLHLENIQAIDTQERDGNLEYPAQDFWHHTTAAQRAEAFLKTIGKYTHETTKS